MTPGSTVMACWIATATSRGVRRTCFASAKLTVVERSPNAASGGYSQVTSSTVRSGHFCSVVACSTAALITATSVCFRFSTGIPQQSYQRTSYPFRLTFYVSRLPPCPSRLLAPLWILEQPHFDLVQPHLDQLLTLQVGFHLANLLEAGRGGRVPGHKQAATVLVRDDRDLVGTQYPRLLNDLFLVAADQGPQDGDPHRFL